MAGAIHRTGVLDTFNHAFVTTALTPWLLHDRSRARRLQPSYEIHYFNDTQGTNILAGDLPSLC
jgi:hypothetical protein